jgi:hypothetical protein
MADTSVVGTGDIFSACPFADGICATRALNLKPSSSPESPYPRCGALSTLSWGACEMDAGRLWFASAFKPLPCAISTRSVISPSYPWKV